MSGQYKLQNDGNGYQESGDFDFTNMNRGDFGFIIGFGFGTDFGKKQSWAINLRYIHGVSDLNKNKESGNQYYVHNQTRSLSLSFILMVL
jgi:hypothetical protein